MTNKKLVTLMECAIMISLATILSRIIVFQMPNGGAITAASMVPLVIISFRHGIKWGMFTGFTYSLLQMLLKFDAPPTKTFLSFLIVILLDYVIAFTVIGSAFLFGKPFKNKTISIAVGVLSVTSIRFLCSYLSGIIIWGSYAPEGTSVWYYSLTYNGSYMVPEIILTTIVSVLILKVPQISKKSFN